MAMCPGNVGRSHLVTRDTAFLPRSLMPHTRPCPNTIAGCRTDPKLTTEVYGHLAPGYLRAEVFGIGGAPPNDEPHEARQSAIAG